MDELKVLAFILLPNNEHKKNNNWSDIDLFDWMDNHSIVHQWCIVYDINNNDNQKKKPKKVQSIVVIWCLIIKEEEEKKRNLFS